MDLGEVWEFEWSGGTPHHQGFIAVLAKRRQLIFGPKFPETSYFPEEWHV